VAAGHGSIYGSTVPGSSDHDWNTPSVNESIKNNWRAICAKHSIHINAHMGASTGAFIAEIIGVLVFHLVGVVILFQVLMGRVKLR
jgi:hypothetical protein